MKLSTFSNVLKQSLKIKRKKKENEEFPKNGRLFEIFPLRLPVSHVGYSQKVYADRPWKYFRVRCEYSYYEIPEEIERLELPRG